jgi:hypothetical protein
MSRFVITIRETTDHQIVIEADTQTKARRKAERVWREFDDSSFEQSIGPRQMFCRPAIRPEDEKLQCR